MKILIYCKLEKPYLYYWSSSVEGCYDSYHTLSNKHLDDFCLSGKIIGYIECDDNNNNVKNIIKFSYYNCKDICDYALKIFKYETFKTIVPILPKDLEKKCFKVFDRDTTEEYMLLQLSSRDVIQVFNINDVRIK